eukprot:4271213-Pleurochrysis_carterae.AAC.1
MPGGCACAGMPPTPAARAVRPRARSCYAAAPGVLLRMRSTAAPRRRRRTARPAYRRAACERRPRAARRAQLRRVPRRRPARRGPVASARR